VGIAETKAGLGVGCGRGSPPPAVRVRGIIPGKFLKTEMLNPAFWYTCCEISCFLKMGQEVGEPIHCWSPNLKVGGPVYHGPYGCWAYAYLINFKRRYRASRVISATAERVVLTTGTIRDPCPLDVDSQTALGDAFSFRDWIAQHRQQIDSAGKTAVFDPAKHQLQAS